jgi:hypothetical protein
MRRWALTLGWLCLVSCGPPVSEKPLTPPEQSVADKALLGHWRGEVVGDEGAEAKNVKLDVVVKSGGVMRLTLSPAKKKDTPLVMEGHVSEVGPLHLLNLRDMTDPKFPGQDFTLARYEVDKSGTLTVWVMAEEPLAQAFKSGALKGVMEGSPPSPRITDAPAAVMAFIRKGKPGELFEKFAEFHREKPKP